MKTKIYFNGKKITKKAAIEMVGKERFAAYLADAKEGFINDPNEEQSWFIGKGMLTIEFA